MARGMAGLAMIFWAGAALAQTGPQVHETAPRGLTAPANPASNNPGLPATSPNAAPTPGQCQNLKAAAAASPSFAHAYAARIAACNGLVTAKATAPHVEVHEAAKTVDTRADVRADAPHANVRDAAGKAEPKTPN
jgi:hypothetical protein